MLKLRKNKKGFTLVELIVVVAIMAVLAGTVAGVVVSTQNKTKNSSADSSAKNIAKQIAELLNVDYQEGSDTPTYVSVAVDGTVTYTAGTKVAAVIEAIAAANDTGAIDQTTGHKAGTNKYCVTVVDNTITVTYTTLGTGAKETGYVVAYNKTSDSFAVTAQ